MNFIVKRNISNFSSRKVLVMSKKKPFLGSERKAKKYYNKLFNEINKSSGLINLKSFSLQDENLEEFITFTEWENFECWDNWKNSAERYEIYSLFKDSVDHEKHYVLQDLKYNFPLL